MHLPIWIYLCVYNEQTYSILISCVESNSYNFVQQYEFFSYNVWCIVNIYIIMISKMSLRRMFMLHRQHWCVLQGPLRYAMFPNNCEPGICAMNNAGIVSMPGDILGVSLCVPVSQWQMGFQRISNEQLLFVIQLLIWSNYYQPESMPHILHGKWYAALSGVLLLFVVFVHKC